MGDYPVMDPWLFRHGRLLYRYPGSDACRFSSKKAWYLLRHIKVEKGINNILLDPFCGTGVIPSMAAFFFSSKFQSVVASDINPDAVDCSRRNFHVLTDPDAAEKRLGQMRGMMRHSPKWHRTWGELAVYLEGLIPTIRRGNFVRAEAFQGSAFDLSTSRTDKIHFVGDLPYNNTSSLLGGNDLRDILESFRKRFPDCTFTFVMPTQDLPGSLAGYQTWPYIGGRSIVRYGYSAEALR